MGSKGLQRDQASESRHRVALGQAWGAAGGTRRRGQAAPLPQAAQPRHPQGEMPPPRSHRAHPKGAGCTTAGRAAQPCPAGAATGTGTMRSKRTKSETDPGGIPPPPPAARESQLGQRGFPPGMSGFPKSTPSDSRTDHSCCTLAACKNEDPLFVVDPKNQA